MSILADLYNTTAKIERVTRTNDDLGGFTETWTTQEMIPCRVRMLSGNERVQYQKDTTVELMRMYCNVTDLTTGNRITIGDKLYNVIQVDNPHGMGEFLQVDMEYREAVNG